MDRLQAHATGSPRTFRIEQIAVVGTAPRQQLATAQLGLATSPHPVSNQGTLVRSYSAANLPQQLIIPHKSLDPFDPTAVLGECSDLEQLRDRVVG